MFGHQRFGLCLPVVDVFLSYEGDSAMHGAVSCGTVSGGFALCQGDA